jgi:hypothetical protein
MRMSVCTSRRASSRASTSTCNVGPSAARVADACFRNSAASTRVKNRQIGILRILPGKRWVVPIRAQKPSERNTVNNTRCAHSHPKVAQLVLLYRIEQRDFVLPAREIIRFRTLQNASDQFHHRLRKSGSRAGTPGLRPANLHVLPRRIRVCRTMLSAILDDGILLTTRPEGAMPGRCDPRVLV